MRDRRNGNHNLRVTVATVVLAITALAGLATAAPAAAVAPAADLDTLDVVPPEPAPTPVVEETVQLIEAHVIVVSTPAAAPAKTPDVVTTTPAEPSDAPGRPAGTVDIGEADTVERDDTEAATVTLRIEVPATEAANRTVTVRTTDGEVLAGPFTVDGDPIEVDGLDAGAVDIYVEDRWHGGGSTLARTPTTLTAGRTHVARCDGESLECTVD